MDTSIECAELTLGYWLALAMSDVIVTQSDPTDGGGAQVTHISTQRMLSIYTAFMSHAIYRSYQHTLSPPIPPHRTPPSLLIRMPEGQ